MLLVSADCCRILNFSYGVFALGSSAYPHFCGFGKWLDTSLSRLDGHRLLQVGIGDELGDRDGEFQRWSKRALQKACIESGIEIKESIQGISPLILKAEITEMTFGNCHSHCHSPVMVFCSSRAIYQGFSQCPL